MQLKLIMNEWVSFGDDLCFYLRWWWVREFVTRGHASHAVEWQVILTNEKILEQLSQVVEIVVNHSWQRSKEPKVVLQRKRGRKKRWSKLWDNSKN